jgi:hypothetical protein
MKVYENTTEFEHFEFYLNSPEFESVSLLSALCNIMHVALYEYIYMYHGRIKNPGSPKVPLNMRPYMSFSKKIRMQCISLYVELHQFAACNSHTTALHWEMPPSNFLPTVAAVSVCILSSTPI